MTWGITKKSYVVNGVRGTIAELSGYFGLVSASIAIDRVELGWSVDKAVTTPQVRKMRNYEAFGLRGSLSALVDKFSTVSESTVRKRIQYGWSLEDALALPKSKTLKKE